MKLLLVIAAIVVSMSATAQASTKEIMLDMISFIEEHTTMKYNNERLPYVEILTLDEMCRDLLAPEDYEAIENPSENCPYAGYYDDTIDVIYISDKPPKLMEMEDFIETVMMHELVHFMQDINGRYHMVECMQELEADAYIVQRKYIKAKGLNEKNLPDPLFALISSTCPRDWMVPDEPSKRN